MASRLNFPQRYLLFQLVRFALVGFFLAGGLFGDLLVPRDLRDAPHAGGGGRVRGGGQLGFVMHSRWSFRGHGQREDHKLKIKFVAVSVVRVRAE